jgi:hypothetical protein
VTRARRRPSGSARAFACFGWVAVQGLARWLGAVIGQQLGGPLDQPDVDALGVRRARERALAYLVLP